jgi:zinc transport system substrate-binding protein
MLKAFSIMFSVLLFVIVALFIYPFYNPESGKSDGKISVAVTIYPTYDIVKSIAKDRVNLHQIIPFGTEPHSFEPNPQDVMRITNSQLFIFTGAKVDYWADEFADFNPKDDKFMRLSEDITIINGDPHFWQSVANMKILASEIAGRLIELDSVNSAFYKENLSEYLAKLEKLSNDFQIGLSQCRLDSIVVNHDAFNYLAKDYNFKSYSVMGLSPDERPSAKTIAEIIESVKKHNISTLFFEELASGSVIETIAKETGVKVSILSPLGNVEPTKVEDGYVNLMYENLTKLREALDCQ